MKKYIELAESEKKFRLLSENSSDMVYRASLVDGKYEYVSKASKEIFGYFPKELYDNPLLIRDSFHPESLIRFDNEWAKILNGEISPTYEYKILDKFGKEKWLFQRNTIVLDENDKPIAIEGSVTDITARKMMEIKLEELNNTKNKLFSIIADDLRSPFNTIIELSEILQRSHTAIDNNKREEIISSISSNAKIANKLVEDLLIWSRSQSDNIDFSPKKINLNVNVLKELMLLNNDANKKEILISNNLDSKINVFADKDMLSVIIYNLISNAIKYTNRGGEVILSSASIENKFEKISIKDNGIGIDKSRIEKIFILEKGNLIKGTENEKGTGLGLQICKEFISKHGGKIWVESQLKVGTTFFFTIPKNKINEEYNIA